MAPALDGRGLGLLWCLPFAGLLLSIALLPLLAQHFWHRHYGKIAAFWALAFLLPLASRYGLALTAHEIAHTFFLEYLPFVILLLALFTVAGGVRIEGGFTGSPASNTALLALGTALASVAGTTGAAVLLIRPLIAANAWRRAPVHVFVFFIFLVCNIGGALTPLGDPPLFLGFLAGVGFFWPALHLLAPTAVLLAVLFPLFFVIDRRHYRRETPPPERRVVPLTLAGKRNLALLAVVVGAVLMSGAWDSGVRFTVLGSELELENLLRDLILVAVTVVSLRITHATIHQANGFSWFPMLEVAKLFAGLFLTIIPAVAILRAGSEGALAPLVGLVSGAGGRPIEALYFWLTGGLSSVLDNAPTYLMFFNTAGGDAAQLMGPLAGTLATISAGAVFMGANSYVGNAPNFMVKSICEERGIAMPSFFAYILWALAVLAPLYLLLTLLFFRF